MKDVKKTRWGMLAFTLALGAVLVLGGCSLDPGDGPGSNGGGGGGGGSGGGGGGSGSALGETLRLSGQVYVFNRDGTFTPFAGSNLAVFSELGGSGTISNGQLSFIIGTPQYLENNFRELFGVDYLNNFTVSPVTTRGAFLFLRTLNGDDLDRGNFYFSSTNNFVYEAVFYLYVDRDVTIRADRTVVETWRDSSYSQLITDITNAFNLNLRTGWNALHYRNVFVGTDTNLTYTYTFSAANPGNLFWILNFRI